MHAFALIIQVSLSIIYLRLIHMLHTLSLFLSLSLSLSLTKVPQAD